MKIVKTLTVIALATVAASSFAKTNPVNANRVTKSAVVNYQCQDGRVSVRYGFNAANLPVTATAKVNGANRVMKVDLNKSDNVSSVFRGNGYMLNAEALTFKNVRKSAIANITSPKNDLVFKDCSPR